MLDYSEREKDRAKRKRQNSLLYHPCMSMSVLLSILYSMYLVSILIREEHHTGINTLNI